MAQLSVKQVLTQSIEMFNIQAERDHNLIEGAINEVDGKLQTLDEKSTVLYGDVIDGYDSDVIASYATVEGAVNTSTFTTSTRLNLNQATRIGIGIAKSQAKKDHDAIQGLINIQAENAAITDSELQALFPDLVAAKYRSNHSDTYNFYNSPQDLLIDLKNDTLTAETYKDATYIGINGNVITISNGGSTESFNIVDSGEYASIVASSSTFEVHYNTRAISRLN